MVRIFFDEVLYVESLKEYCRIFTTTENWVTRGQIGEMEILFQDYGFLRIHRSYLVSIAKIKVYSPVEITVGGQNLPIGRSYKRKVLDAMSS